MTTGLILFAREYATKAVAEERERIKAALLAMHERSKQSHNYYACAAVEIFGQLTTPTAQEDAK